MHHQFITPSPHPSLPLSPSSAKQPFHFFFFFTFVTSINFVFVGRKLGIPKQRGSYLTGTLQSLLLHATQCLNYFMCLSMGCPPTLYTVKRSRCSYFVSPTRRTCRLYSIKIAFFSYRLIRVSLSVLNNEDKET